MEMLIDPEKVAERIRSTRPTNRRTTLVAIGGRGGAGKTTLAAELSKHMGAAVVHADDFAQPGVPGWDWQRCYDQVIEPLLHDQPGRYQRYDWDTDRLAEWHDVSAGGVLILEGVSSFRKELAVPWDLKVWVDVPREESLRRGVERDGEPMRKQWEQVWMVEEDRYIAYEKPQDQADLTYKGY